MAHGEGADPAPHMDPDLRCERPAGHEADLLEALKLALRYLEHPDVQRIPFSLPASVPADRARAAIEEAS